MIKNNIKGVDISIISLGTVQLGLNYGINNNNGKPDRRTAFDILNSAINEGINTLDTAAAYGDSEAVIGEWLKTIPAEKHPFIATKLKALDHSSLANLREDVKRKVEESKENLGLSQLPLLMLHSCDEYICDVENITKVFDELKSAGDIKFSGISAYAHHDYGIIANSGFDAVQIPMNLFDWRQVDCGGYKKLVESGMMIFVRSIYLQGLIFRDSAKLEDDMQFCRETLEKFEGFCEKFGMSRIQLALSYAVSMPGITSLVLGSETAAQVADNASLMRSVTKLTDEQMEELHVAFGNTSERVLNPNKWPNA